MTLPKAHLLNRAWQAVHPGRFVVTAIKPPDPKAPVGQNGGTSHGANGKTAHPALYLKRGHVPWFAAAGITVVPQLVELVLAPTPQAPATVQCKTVVTGRCYGGDPDVGSHELDLYRGRPGAARHTQLTRKVAAPGEHAPILCKGKTVPLTSLYRHNTL